jgi:Mn2+/Fe2+ NRAMP family transporter
MFSDAFAQVGLLDYSNTTQRRRWICGFAWFFPCAWTVLGLTFEAPVAMVTAGGVANAVLLILVVYAAYTFRYQRLPSDLRPGRLYDVFLWISFVSISAVGVLAVTKLFY